MGLPAKECVLKYGHEGSNPSTSAKLFRDSNLGDRIPLLTEMEAGSSPT